MTDKPPYVHEEWRGGRLIRRRYWRRMDGKPFTRPLPSDRPFTHPTFISAYESARRDFEALSSGSTKPAKGSVTISTVMPRPSSRPQVSTTPAAAAPITTGSNSQGKGFGR